MSEVWELAARRARERWGSKLVRVWIAGGVFLASVKDGQRRVQYRYDRARMIWRRDGATITVNTPRT